MGMCVHLYTTHRYMPEILLWSGLVIWEICGHMWDWANPTVWKGKCSGVEESGAKPSELEKSGLLSWYLPAVCRKKCSATRAACGSRTTGCTYGSISPRKRDSKKNTRSQRRKGWLNLSRPEWLKEKPRLLRGRGRRRRGKDFKVKQQLCGF